MRRKEERERRKTDSRTDALTDRRIEVKRWERYKCSRGYVYVGVFFVS